jgi:hypothetical protein
MPELTGQPGELRATVHVTRKATGKVETYELVGHVMPQAEDPKEKSDGGNAQHRSP